MANTFKLYNCKEMTKINISFILFAQLPGTHSNIFQLNRYLKTASLLLIVFEDLHCVTAQIPVIFVGGKEREESLYILVLR